jgi:hypothetical protein
MLRTTISRRGIVALLLGLPPSAGSDSVVLKHMLIGIDSELPR